MPDLCAIGANVMSDEPSFDDPEAVSIIMGHMPSGTSTKCMQHLVQVATAGTFQHYDDGSGTPAPYDLTKVSVPIANFVFKNDPVAIPEDVDWLDEQIGDKLVFRGDYDGGHMTMFFAKDMSYLEDVKAVFAEHFPVSSA